MKVLFCIKALAAGPGGGAERILSEISSALAERSHDISLLTFDKPGTEDFYRVSANVGRIRLGIGETTAKSGLFVTAARLRQLRKVVRQQSPDVVVGFMHSSFTVAGLAAIGTDVPVLGSERTSYRHYRLNRFDQAMLLLAQPFLTRMTVNSEGVRKGFPHFISKRMTVIPNPVEVRDSYADPIGGREKILLSVGGLRPEKNHESLVRAFALARQQHPDWTLRIVGDGKLRSRLMAVAKDLAIERFVELAGATALVDREYQRAQLFALPSIYEGFPNCLAEALAHGLPAIGYADCPGTNELISTGTNGILVTGDDPVAGLAAALREMMSSPEKRRLMGAAAVHSVTGYSIDLITDKWEEVLQSVVSKGH